jgi:hypothetical protein
MVDEIPTTLKMKFSLQKIVRESTNWRTPAKKIDVNGDLVQKNVLYPSLGEEMGQVRGVLDTKNKHWCCQAYRKRSQKDQNFAFFSPMIALDGGVFSILRT